MSGITGIIIEGLVAVLLATTIGWCVALDRRLKRLKADTAEFRLTIAELMVATERAERAILSLKSAASQCDESLSERLAEAERLSQAISAEVASGHDVLERITRVTLAARGRPEPAEPAPAPAVAPPTPRSAPPLRAMQQPAADAVARALGIVDAAREAGRVAERLDARRAGARA